MVTKINWTEATPLSAANLDQMEKNVHDLSIGHEHDGIESKKLGVLCSTTMGAAQTINSDTYTILNFDTVIHDTHSGFNTTVHKYVVPKTGFYLIQLQIFVTNSTASDWYGLGVKKGTSYILFTPHIMGAVPDINAGFMLTLSGIARLAQNDEVFPYLWHLSSGTRSVGTAGSGQEAEIYFNLALLMRD